ncbi:MAG: hypothetical protein IPM54_18815 [Polyangiaceae bacterium]|nr:hypothetical protein [Polyangiaceae bacterium]
MKIERAWFFVACFGVVAAHFVGCSDPPEVTTPPTSSSSGSSSGDGGAGGSGGGGAGGGSSSSSGMPPECTTAADCTNHGTADFCGEPECSDGKCGRKGLQAPGTPLPSQLYGDCLERQCDSSFNIAEVAADDVYDDAKECTTDVCTNGVLSHEPVAQGTLCTQPTGAQGICDGTGACVTCLDGVQSCTGSFVCQMNTCVNMKCTNTIQDPGESDVDCGAVGCLPCADGLKCTNFTQCASSVCTNGMCAAPSCSDAFKNGNETGFDCGGADCNKCADNEGCVTPNDCQSGVCKAGVCIPPTCTDAVQNADEGGIDCGGACPTPCP